MGTQDEVREWLSLAPADFPVWGAAACIIGMKFSKNSTIDWSLAVVALVLTVVACFMGMNRDHRVSNFSNVVKKVAYPACVVAVLVLTYVNFTKWN